MATDNDAVNSVTRRGEIDRRVTERYLLLPGDRWAYRHDPVQRAEIERARLLLYATEAAMALEGVPLEQRDRVIFRMLYGDPPEGIGQLDWRVARERAIARLAKVHAMFHHAYPDSLWKVQE